ncbi:MAG: hypothetical protein MJ141_05135, partial [Clostridia bacterium]|nr:hypothetical protein [Clostridia bacterium]
GKNKGASALYLSYFVQKPTVINPGEEEKTPEAGEDVLYLSALTLTVQKTAYAAKTALTKEGYTVIDQNLTNFLGVESQLYSYLGYKTTKLASLAITDIRVMTGGNYPESVNYGAATYSRAGSASAGGAAIYYTRSDMAGTPVYPDLQVVSERSAAKEGFEPVNLFSGGPAYNFNNCDYVGDYGYANLSYKRWNQNGLYIYFHPSVTYTSGTEYLGGMAFFTGCEITARSGDEILEYGEDMGYELFAGCDFTADYAMTVTVTTTDSYNAMSSGAHYIDCDDFTTYLGLTKTYTPHRAIYAVKSYTAMPGASSLQPALYIPGEAKAANEPATGCGYAACGVYCQYIRRLDQDAGTLGNSVRGMSPANSYLGRRNVAPYPGITLDDERTVLQDREEFERFGWMESGVRLKNLYVSGRAEGMSPLEADTLEIFDDPREQKEKNDAGFYCVGDLRVPAESGIHNLAYSDENPVYLAVKCAPEEKKAYISEISVVSWDMKTAVGDDKKYADLDDDEKEAYDRKADDVCISQLRAQCRDEILIRNLAVSFKDSKGADPDNTPEQCSYIGVTRTNDETKAIRAIIKFQYSGSGKPNSTITVRGVRYTRAGDSPVHDPKTGDYYLYYTTNNGAAPGEPITSIDFSAVPMIEGAATVLTATEQDVAERTRSGEVIQEGKIAELKSRGGESNYIHAYFNTDKSHICDIYVGVGNTEEAAMIDLMNMGCSILLPVDMNKSSNGKYIFLGYDRNFSESLSDKYAVRDILCTVGHAPQESIEYNGMTYIRARDKYIMSYDPTHAVSLNEGTNGFAIYLYYTLDRTDPSLNPIRNLGVTLKDFVPDNNGALVWENVMTTSGRRCNFNDGVYATEDGHSVDTRIYLYANRDGNVVKAGASVYGGSTMGSENLGGVGMMRFGTLVLE